MWHEFKSLLHDDFNNEKLMIVLLDSSSNLVLVPMIINFSSIMNIGIDEPQRSGQKLPWKTRLMIAAEMAEALSYLHSMDRPIIFRDFKTSNILLDEVNVAMIQTCRLFHDIDVM
ncbi:hypothetical protein SADUNF_Sadunf18G0105600 [Salix dunnii]|uniref:Protein kinase domain-containing protein n=1 Tax=Salix dunnii TaxID=1413687 RepID=A0A835MJ85_9ROSI|nr:hypothetical protein SADUNF_Sadunf18G0105600 [Salix dunnii]